MKCPRITDTAIISDDPFLAASASARLAAKGRYVAVLDGPRITRDDASAEAIKRTNAIALVKPKTVIACALPPEALALLRPKIPPRMLKVCESEEELRTLLSSPQLDQREPLKWGTSAIGVGLLKAMYEGRSIEFHADAPVERHHPTRSDHLVVVEEGEALSEVIAANYAFSIGAGLALIPAISTEIADEIIEGFYSVEEQREESATAVLGRLRTRIRALCLNVTAPTQGSMTFISRDLPLGYGFPECPTTHLFTYPDLGRTVINGFAAEQPSTRGINVAVVLDPGTTPAPEIEEAAISLANRSILVRGYRKGAANVRDVTEMVECFPYDLLIIATHCGDTSGYRETYEFIDSEGHARTLVADVGVGFARSDDPNMVRVAQHIRFISLDGVDWNDREAKSKLYVGTAMRDFMKRDAGSRELKPVARERIDRVVGTAGLQMSDSVYLPFFHTLADNQTPIIINNACTSWRELASRFMFGGARAYVGTIVPVNGVEAEELTRSLLGKTYGKLLAHAVWASQRKIYGRDGRSPFIVTGVYPQKLRTTRQDTHAMIEKKLREGLAFWEERARRATQEPGAPEKGIAERVAYYKTEVQNFQSFLKQRRQERADRHYGVGAR